MVVPYVALLASGLEAEIGTISFRLQATTYLVDWWYVNGKGVNIVPLFKEYYQAKRYAIKNMCLLNNHVTFSMYLNRVPNLEPFFIPLKDSVMCQ
jgi:hypothetical protein